MRRKIFEIIFKKELDAYNYIIRDCETKCRNTLAEVEISKRKYELCKRIFSLFPSAKIIAIEENKTGEEMFVVEKITEKAITIYLFSKTYQGITGLPRIESTIREDYETGKKHIHIDDILNQDNGIGNGSILMKYFIKECKQEGLEYIDGWLSDVDKDHFDRLEQFYKKFIFDVKFNENRTSGNIKLKI